MTSGATDFGYSKPKCTSLAKNDPRAARLNAATYVFFAAENGASRSDYLKAKGSLYTRDGTKKDSVYGCGPLV